MRRRLLAVSVVFTALGYVGGGVAQSNRGQTVELAAAKYAFSRPEIRVKRGQPVTFVLTTDDFPHGFGVPDFKVRVDLIPGKAVRLSFTPDRAGKFHFLCDNFCGEGHDQMSGFLVVE